MDTSNFRVIADIRGRKACVICTTDFIVSAIEYCQTEGRYHETTFYIQKWFNGEYFPVTAFYAGTEIPF